MNVGSNLYMVKLNLLFQIHFIVVALLFLIFDLEILLLLFPIAVTLYQVSTFGFP